jgi:hypothetical protein
MLAPKKSKSDSEKYRVGQYAQNMALNSDMEDLWESRRQIAKQEVIANFVIESEQELGGKFKFRAIDSIPNP